MNDIASLTYIGADMIEKCNFFWLIPVSFHTFWFVHDDQMLVLVDFLDKIRISPNNFFCRIILLVENQLTFISGFDSLMPVDFFLIDENVLFNSQEMPYFSWNE